MVAKIMAGEERGNDKYKNVAGVTVLQCKQMSYDANVDMCIYKHLYSI